MRKPRQRLVLLPRSASWMSFALAALALPVAIVGAGRHSTAAASEAKRPRPVTVAVGHGHTCSVMSDGGVDCWGQDYVTRIAHHAPVPVPGVSGAVQVSGGAGTNCALLRAGAIACWGNGDHGELGNGQSSDSSTPVRVGSISHARALSTGITHSCAIVGGGSVACWGANEHGGLGDGTQADSAVPVAVHGISHAISVSAGYESTCVALSTGRVRCWGSNNRGQLGNGVVGGSSRVPTSVLGIRAATSVSANGTHACAVLRSGVVECWGSNADGELGDGGTRASAVPVRVTGIAHASAVSVAQRGFSCVLVRGGSVYCFGFNERDQLGNGRQPAGSTTPVRALIAHAVSISSDNSHSCALLSTGGVECWGFNDYGQLGIGRAGAPAIRNPGRVAF